jgi:hypothetical protein
MWELLAENRETGKGLEGRYDGLHTVHAVIGRCAEQTFGPSCGGVS